jgi:hypothetical protein
MKQMSKDLSKLKENLEQKSYNEPKTNADLEEYLKEGSPIR